MPLQGSDIGTFLLLAFQRSLLSHSYILKARVVINLRSGLIVRSLFSEIYRTTVLRAYWTTACVVVNGCKMYVSA